MQSRGVLLKLFSYIHLKGVFPPQTTLQMLKTTTKQKVFDVQQSQKRSTVLLKQCLKHAVTQS